jgi:hypothetical protein
MEEATMALNWKGLVPKKSKTKRRRFTKPKIQKEFEKWYVKKFGERRQPRCIHPSSAGKCAAVTYFMLTEKPKALSLSQVKNGRDGMHRHDRLEDEITQFMKEVYDKDLETEVRIPYDKSSNTAGRADAADDVLLWEFKGVPCRFWKETLEPRPMDVFQAGFYMVRLGKKKGIIIYEKKCDMTQRWHELEMTDEFKKEIMDRFKMLHTAYKKREIVREYKPASKECYFCTWKHHCRPKEDKNESK